MKDELQFFEENEFSDTQVREATDNEHSAMYESREKGFNKIRLKMAEERKQLLIDSANQTNINADTEQVSIFSKEEIFEEVVHYFGGDELAAGVWIDKYALKNELGELLERTPDEMHHRIAKEFARIEKKYANPMSEELIYALVQKFRYIIPQGSPMAGIGNQHQISSLSNCFVIGNNGESDSYGGIMKMDEEQVQLMKRRGGVGHDLSHIRPSGSFVKNCALTSTGVVPFMERYSNSTREVAQDGRRGALMLSISIKHPDVEHFIDAKMIEGKVTGANVSVKVDDKFMESVKKGNSYRQQYPINSNHPSVVKEVEAGKLWDKIIHNAWKSAEPGVLFWDTISNEAIPNCYAEEGFQTVSTNPCGEIPLCPYDSCRLLLLNLYNYVENPFTDEATFNMTLFKEHAQYAQRLMDDLIDLEIEKIDRILSKIENDPETGDVKRVEWELWNKIRAKSLKGRRTGLGITAEGDMLAALNIRYGSDHCIAFATEVHKQLALSAYKASVDMAKERGAFPIYSCIKEGNNPFINRIKEADPKLYDEMVRFGRRNIALLTIAPAGSVSICTQTTSGIEPAFNVFYTRKRKINPNDLTLNKRKTFKDTTGDCFEEYKTYHPKFVDWAEMHGYTKEKMDTMENEELMALIARSPYYKATAADTDYFKKVELQGKVQQWVDHSISVTINLPKNTTEATIGKLYLKAWESKCKGMTVYREGSRDGILTNNSTEAPKPKETQKMVRPRELKAEIIRFKNNSEDWIAFLGLKNGKPYEIFTGKTEDDVLNVPKWVDSGKIIKDKLLDGTKTYDFYFYDRDGYEVIMRGLSRCFNPEFWNYAKMISALLRHEIPTEDVINIISGLNFKEENINSWKNGVIRALKKCVNEGTVAKGIVCPKCNEVNTMEFREGCLTCAACGHSKCGG
ncbi:MAG: adenosylcobalamin-dependent ribonucleoside-diphosphate reductase [Bacteroidales bacterium]|jgi:ribonucleoside-diphosphate reductase alpha chain|nr:adenosylcobalamin-dependent ribonucleoside-diphosphate reductase [Bacteroidales bacterium]